MKVKELMEKLLQYDPEELVCIYNCDNDFTHYFMYIQEILDKQTEKKQVAIHISTEQ